MNGKGIDAFSFEEAYARLESILSELNSGELVLEKSLRLYEEANQLITHCHQKLTFAEQKIQMLTKNREGQLEMRTISEEKLKEYSHQPSDGTSRASIPST